MITLSTVSDRLKHFTLHVCQPDRRVHLPIRSLLHLASPARYALGPSSEIQFCLGTENSL